MVLHGEITVLALLPPKLKPKPLSYSLKTMAKWVLSILPKRQTLNIFRAGTSKNARDYQGVWQALQGRKNINAWRNQNDDIILTSATPIMVQKNIIGAALITRQAE